MGKRGRKAARDAKYAMIDRSNGIDTTVILRRLPEGTFEGVSVEQKPSIDHLDRRRIITSDLAGLFDAGRQKP